MGNKTIITCALTGVLTDPKRHPVPVSTKEMASSAKEAFEAGASIMHVHFRNQHPGMGHLPSWDPQIAMEICEAIRSACPGVIINMSTGVIGPDISAQVACLRAVKPEIAACNAGTLNYLKTRSSTAKWAWTPMIFDNPVDKIQGFLKVMHDLGTKPEFECFDTGIVRSVGMFEHVGMTDGHPSDINFVMGVESGMPADPDLLPLLLKYIKKESPWQVTAIGRREVWPLHTRCAQLGGNLRTGVEDTFYLPDGKRCRGNGDLINTMAGIARNAGRDIASPDEARGLLRLAQTMN